MANDLTTPNGFLEANDSEYVRLVSLISGVWEKAKGKAAIAVNTGMTGACSHRCSTTYPLTLPSMSGRTAT